MNLYTCFNSAPEDGGNLTEAHFFHTHAISIRICTTKKGSSSLN